MYSQGLHANAVPPEQRFSTRTVAPGMAPGAECGYNIAIGVAPGQPCGYGRGMPMGGGYDESGRPMGVGYDAGRSMGGGYGQPIASERRPSGMSSAAQCSRERFKEFAEKDTALNIAELTDMVPQVKRLMDIRGRMEDIMNISRNYEGPMVQPSSGYAGPPMRSRGSFERPMNAAGCLGRQPMAGYDAPMRLAPDYAGPPDRHYGLPERYDGPPDRYDGPPDRYDGPPDRYDGPPDRYERPPDRYDGPPPNARSYGRRAFPGEDSRSAWEDHELPVRASPKQHSQRRASELLRKIREDIEEHCANATFQQIDREVAGYETDEKEERPVRGGSLPPSKTRPPRSIRDDDGESRRARRFRDDYDVPRRSPSPRRQPLRKRQESSSSTSSSSDGKSRRSRTSPRRKDSTKSLKSRSKRRSKSKTKRSSSSSSSSSSRGRGRGKFKSANKKSSSSSSSFSLEVRPGKKKKSKVVEFKRSVTGRMSSEAQKDLENIHKQCEAVVKSLSSTLGGYGCPVLNMLGIRSREEKVLDRPPSRNIVDALPMYVVEERRRSRNFGGEMMAHNGISRTPSKNLRGEVVGHNSVSRSTSRKLSREMEGYDDGVQMPRSRSFDGQAQGMLPRGSVYRYESKPSAFKRD